MSAIGTSTVSTSRLGSRASTTVTGGPRRPVPSANSSWSDVAMAPSRPPAGPAPCRRGRRAAQEARDLVEVALRRRQADALQRLLDQALQPFERQRQVRAALGGHQRVDLVDDHRVHRSQPLARVRRQQQEQRLGRGDQDVGGVALEARALVRRRVAGADRHRRHVEGHALRRGQVGDAGERRAQVALDVHGQRLERRQIQHAAARVAFRHRREHQPIEARQERGQRLARAGRRENQRGLAAAMAGQPCRCGRVGASNAALNQAATGG